MKGTFLSNAKKKMVGVDIKKSRFLSCDLTVVKSKDSHSGYIGIAGFDRMSKTEKRMLRNGTGFVRVPDEERERQRIDSYSFLVR